jgi:hypothetical protein
MRIEGVRSIVDERAQLEGAFNLAKAGARGQALDNCRWEREGQHL